MCSGGETWYNCLDNTNGNQSWSIVVMLLFAVFDTKRILGKAFSQARDLDVRIFEDKNLDIQSTAYFRERASGKMLGDPKVYRYPLVYIVSD